MLYKLRSRLTYANVTASIALFVALGGTGAWATHEVILSSDIVNGEVKTPDLANLGSRPPSSPIARSRPRSSPTARSRAPS